MLYLKYDSQDDIILVANELIGQSIFTQFDGQMSGGIVKEVEIFLPDTILIKSIDPTHGEELMLKRLGETQISSILTNTPENVAIALGLPSDAGKISLDGENIWAEIRSTEQQCMEISALKT